MNAIEKLLHHPLIHLKDGEVTPGSLLAALALLALTLLVANAVGRAVGRMFAARGLSNGAQFAGSKIARYVLFIIGAVVAISSAGFDLTAVIAASTVLLVGIGFGLQNIAQNFISGLIVLIEQPVRQGDFIHVGDAFGVVQDIGLRATKVVTRDQVTIIVPNSELVSSQVINHSKPTLNLRIPVKVGVAYGSDVSTVRETLLRVAGATEPVLRDPKPEVRFESFGDSSLDFSLLVWIADPREDLRIASELRFAIDAAFREAGIEIPFPQRDVHVRSVVAAASPAAGSPRTREA